MVRQVLKALAVPFHQTAGVTCFLSYCELGLAMSKHAEDECVSVSESRGRARWWGTQGTAPSTWAPTALLKTTLALP